MDKALPDLSNADKKVLRANLERLSENELENLRDYKSKSGCEKLMLITMQFVRESDSNYLLEGAVLSVNSMANVLYSETSIFSGSQGTLGRDYTNIDDFVNDMESWHDYFDCGRH